jgi:glycosyltransferase involved in cell wall biosynthesis
MSIKSVQLVLHPDQEGWILHKIAQRLKSGLELLNISVKIVGEPEGDADVYFWMYFGHNGISQHVKKASQSGIRSAFVTHVDDSAKTKKIAKLVKDNVDLVFMSKDHACTVSTGLGIDTFFNILLGSDLAQFNEPYRVGIFSKRFSDGRKNEKWLIRLVRELDLRDIEVVFVGSGWKDISSKLNALGVSTIRYDDVENKYPNYSEFPELYKSLDLFLSPSFDEGSMGSLDAFILGIDMLISRHGFHKELDLNEDNYLDSYDDLKLKFSIRINKFRNRRAKAQEWSWERTSLDLLEHWESLSDKRADSRDVSIHFNASNLDWETKRKYLFRSFYRFIKIDLFERLVSKINGILGGKGRRDF